MKLRDYQERVIHDLFEWFKKNKTGNPIINACVASGKSVLIAHFIHECINRFNTKARILMIVPSKELCEQNLQKLMAVSPDLKIGVMSASMNRKDNLSDKDIVIGTIGSLYNQGVKLGFFNIILCDECHLINRKATGMYRELIKTLSVFNENIRVVGWTGTPFRGDGVWLTEGEDRLFTHIVSEVKIIDLLNDGFLSPLTVVSTGIEVKSEGVKISNGDFAINELSELLDKQELTNSIATSIVELGKDRNKWLVYCVSIEHAKHMSEAINNLGITSAVISSKTHKKERDTIFNALKNGEIRCICNVACLTTGVDVPDLDLIALVRNTQSKVLYTQIAGRGLRIAQGKTDCLWLDFTDTTKNLGPVDLIKGRTEKEKKLGNAPIKVCPECQALNHASAAICDECGHLFPEHQLKIKNKVSKAAVLSKDYEPEWVSVTRVEYARHKGKDGKPDTLRVDYWGDSALFPIRVCSEFISVYASLGYAKLKAQEWLYKRNIDIKLFTTDFNCNIKYLNPIEPTRLLLDTRGKYAKIVDYDFSGACHETA